MLSNADMTESRFLKWHVARNLAAKIDGILADGGEVYVNTYTRRTVFQKKHRGMIIAKRDGLYMQRGKKWDSLFGTSITYRPAISA